MTTLKQFVLDTYDEGKVRESEVMTVAKGRLTDKSVSLPLRLTEEGQEPADGDIILYHENDYFPRLSEIEVSGDLTIIATCAVKEGSPSDHLVVRGEGTITFTDGEQFRVVLGVASDGATLINFDDLDAGVDDEDDEQDEEPIDLRGFALNYSGDRAVATTTDATLVGDQLNFGDFEVKMQLVEGAPSPSNGDTVIQCEPSYFDRESLKLTGDLKIVATRAEKEPDYLVLSGLGTLTFTDIEGRGGVIEVAEHTVRFLEISSPATARTDPAS